MLCILQSKDTIDDNFMLTGNEEDSTDYEYIDIRISPVISESEHSYSISSAPLAAHQTMNPSLKLEKLPLT